MIKNINGNKMPTFMETGKGLVREITKYLHRIRASYLKPKKGQSFARIAALRKQYDEYLEEEKKRKERNDFILGRLDKMRMNSLVPVKKVDTSQKRPSALYRPAPIYKGLLPNTLQGNELQNIGNHQNITANISESELALLEEIGKKFILIPKSPSNVTEHNNETNHINVTAEKENNDWKSKYHILDELKRADKEGIEPNSKNDHFSFKKQNADTSGRETGHDQEPELKYKEEVPEKDILYKQADYGIYNYPEKLVENDENKQYATNNNDQNCELPINSCPEKLYETKNIAEKEMESGKAGNGFRPLYSSQPKSGTRVNELNIVKRENSLLKVDSAALDTHGSNQNKTLNAREYNTIREAIATINNKEAEQGNAGCQNIVSTQNASEAYEPNEGKDKYFEQVDYVVGNHPVIQDVNKVEANDEDDQYPLEAINTHEFTPNEGVILKDGVNINPEGYTLYENYDNPSVPYISDSQPAESVTKPELATETNPQPAPSTVDVPPPVNEEGTEEPVVQNFDIEQIQEFEKEQENMFYQEPNAAYVETTGDGGYVQDQNYEGEQYQYYEGVEQEQHNPLEINEHEEATERHDPSFQVQYDTAHYDYTQQGYEQQGYDQQVYEQQEEYTAPQDESVAPASAYNSSQLPDLYDETKNYDLQVPYEQGYDNVQSVEQQLDSEQGYIEAEQEQTENQAVELKEQVNQNS